MHTAPTSIQAARAPQPADEAESQPNQFRGVGGGGGIDTTPSHLHCGLAQRYRCTRSTKLITWSRRCRCTRLTFCPHSGQAWTQWRVPVMVTTRCP